MKYSNKKLNLLLISTLFLASSFFGLSSLNASELKKV